MNWKARHRTRTIANCDKSAVDDLTAKAFSPQAYDPTIAIDELFATIWSNPPEEQKP